MTNPTYRMSMLPFGTYANPDGSESLGLAVPGMLQEPFNALAHLFGTPSHPGTFGQGPDAPGNADAMRTLLLSTYGGNALSPGRLMEGAAAREISPSLLSDTGKPPSVGMGLAGAEGTAPIRAYRGSGRASDLSPHEESFFSSSSPEVAASYADGPSGAMMPLDLNFSNPMTVDAQGNLWNRVPYNGKNYETNDLLFMAKDAGHDGLIVHNVIDDPDEALNPATTYAALKRGTVTSPLTGETLFSDQLPSLFGGLNQDQNNQIPPRNALFNY